MKLHRIPFKLLLGGALLSMLAGALPALQVTAASSTTFKPTADTYVSAQYPATNFGTRTSLRVDGSPTVVSYLLFDISGLNGASIQSAVLRVYANSFASSGYAVKTVSSTSWSETGMTYQNAPAAGSAIASSGKFSAGAWTQVNVTPAVHGEGLLSLALVDLNSTAINLASRESGATSPQLVLTLSSGTTATQSPTGPTPSPTPTQSPTTAPTTAPTQAPTAAPTATQPAPTPTTAPTPVPTQTPGSSTGPYDVSGSWTLKFADEFNGSSLDLSKWQPNWLGSSNTAITKPINGAEQSCYDPAQVSEGGGALKLAAVARSCDGYPYASGLINSASHYTFTYGYLEARMWLDGSSTVKNWPAFWADGTGTWPTTGEIDVMEGLGGSPAWHYHWGSSGSPQQVGGTPAMSSRTGWHVFGADWEPGAIKFYYDGQYVGQATSGVVGNPMYLILNYGVSSSISGPIQVPSSILVDYVRVWQH